MDHRSIPDFFRPYCCALQDMFVNGYSSALPAEWELEFPNMKAAMEGRHFSSNDTRSCSMTTGLGAKPLRAFSTSHGWGHMLFRDLVQPWYGVPMAHQSWRRGAGGPVPSCCYPSCNFDDINVVSLTVSRLISGGVFRPVCIQFDAGAKCGLKAGRRGIMPME